MGRSTNTHSFMNSSGSSRHHSSIIIPQQDQWVWGGVGVGLRVGGSLGLAHDRWLRMAGLLLTLNSAICVKFTSEGGAKGNSDGQLVCYTLHGVVRQPGQRVQLLPGVGRCGNTFL